MSQLMLFGSRAALCARNNLTRTGRSISKMQMITVRTNTSGSSDSIQALAEKHFQRHIKRGSPMSPYVMYKPQLTSILSITHRITGMGLGVFLYGIGLCELACSNLSFEQILQKIQATVPSSLLSAVKLLTGTAIAFHTFNGVRHLAWDAGYGFALKNLYQSGYAVVGLTLVTLAYMLINSTQ